MQCKDQVISDIIHERALKKIIFSITNERREELEEIELYRNQIHYMIRKYLKYCSRALKSNGSYGNSGLFLKRSQ